MRDPAMVELLRVAFDTVEIDQRTDLGTPYVRKVPVGMPKLSHETTKLVFYLYKSKEDAEKGENSGGTGFLVAKQSTAPGDYRYWVYGVTNWHVAMRDGFSVIRLTAKGRVPDIIELGPEDWVSHPDGDDLAITERPLPVTVLTHEMASIPTNVMVVQERMDNGGKRIGAARNWNVSIGIGEDVFMVGRFIDHDGGPTNNPTVRFGNISAMPSPLKSPTGKIRDCFLLDMHSRTGYSGSPVMVYRTPGGDLAKVVNERKLDLGSAFVMLLGVHWGQFQELWEIKESNQYVKGVSGMTAVVPAWRIIEMLDLPQLEKHRAVTKETITTSPIAESASGNSGGDDILRTMLHTPPTPQTKPKAKAKKGGG